MTEHSDITEGFSNVPSNVVAYTEPFRHWYVRSLLPPALITKCYKRIVELPNGLLDTLPPLDNPVWNRYNNDCEWGKRTLIPPVPPFWQELLGNISHQDSVDHIQRTVGTDITIDSTYYGAGIHLMMPRGWLNCHLDYALHPSLGLERRINLVWFANPEWKEEYGGAFEMYDASARRVVKRIYPSFNSAVIWEAGDTAYHGCQQLSKDAPIRITLACYYLSTPRPGCTRQRALFVPTRA